MRLGTRLECVGSSPRVSGACQDGAREFVGRRAKLVERLSRVAERLVGSWEVADAGLQEQDAPTTGARGSLMKSCRSGPKDMELNLEDKADWKDPS
ncbi:hypothetical protein GW17_00045087 [Ensete ventricosum]|nr:hypothetical protein GW17_00045087 [Ensete ventricosum]